MTVKYSKSFTNKSVISGDPFTIRVEYFEADNFKGISIESLEGFYASSEEFEKAYNQRLNATGMDEAKVFNFIAMSLIDSKRLHAVLAGAIEIAEATKSTGD